ncbi:hypothetical protein ACOSP7_025988 [Xanthoceras sorbifolium]
MGSSADAYLGSFISLISKSEIRYEGVLFHINPHESTIGLKNVTSFGTEGRRKDGPQILPSEKVYEYVYFRGTDIKDLQVLSSVPVMSTLATPNDPAIIQLRYHDPPPAHTNWPPADPVSASHAGSSAQTLPGLTFQGSLSQYQPVGNSGSWSSFGPLNASGNEHCLPMYRQGSNGPSVGLSHLQQLSLLQSSPGLVVSPSQQQQMQHPVTNASLSNGVLNYHDIPSPLPPSLVTASKTRTSTSIPSSGLQSNNLSGSSVLAASNEVSKLMANNQPTTLPSLTLNYSSHLVSPLPSSGLDRNTIIPPVNDQPKSVFGSISPYKSTPFSMPSIAGTSSSNCFETSIPSLVTPDQLLQSEHNTVSSFHSLETIQKDLETANNPSIAHSSKTLTSSSPLLFPLNLSGLDPYTIEPPASDKPNSVLGHVSSHQSMSVSTPSTVGTSSEHNIETSFPSLVTPGQLLQSGPSKLSLSHSLQTAQKDIEVVQASAPELLSPDSKDAEASVLTLPLPSAKKSNGAPLHPQHHDGRRERGKRNGPHRADLHTHRSIGKHFQEREKKVIGAASYMHHTHRVNIRGRGHGVNKAAPYPLYGNRARSRGSVNGILRPVTKFAEDFDFEAMNERFNKDEVWGELGKCNKTQPRDASVSDGESIQHEDANALAKDLKPIYAKDDFFDSLSCYSPKHEPRQGRFKLSEQMKLDAETFGNFQMQQGRRGGWPRGFRYGRGYGRAGRGEGRAVWSRVT